MNESDIKKKEVFITTFDNPFNYFTQFEDWLAYDTNHGYYTLQYLARLVKTSDELSEASQNAEFERAFDSMIEWNGDLYKRIYKE